MSSARILPIVSLLMSIQSDPICSAVLHVLSEKPKGTEVGFKNLRREADNALSGRPTPGSTLFMLLRKMQHAGIVEVTPDKSFLLTPFGETSLRAYAAYEKIIEEGLKVKDAKIESVDGEPSIFCPTCGYRSFNTAVRPNTEIHCDCCGQRMRLVE